jgi:hypothetical protein
MMMMMIIMIMIMMMMIIIIIGSTTRVDYGLLKQMSPANSILGIRPPNSTTQFPCVFLYLVSPS